MKITKSQLRKMIKEEIQKEAHEGGEGVHDIFNLPEPEAVEPSGNRIEDALRTIKATSQREKIDGVGIDITTAGMLLQIIDYHRQMAKKDPDVWEKRLEHYLGLPIEGMLDVLHRGRG